MKVLVIHPFGIGDVIFSFALCEELIKSMPQVRIDYVCNERTQPLVQMFPEFKKVHVFNRDQLRILWITRKIDFLKECLKQLKAVKHERYDMVFDLSLGRDYALVTWLLGIRKRIGFNYKGRGSFLTHKRELKGFNQRPVREEYVSLLEYLELKPHAADYPMLARPKLRSNLVIAPGGGKSWGYDAHYKQWSPERFIEAIKELQAYTHQTVVLLGDAADRALLLHIKAQTQARVFCDKPLGEVVKLVQSASLVIGNDGGLLHLADLLQTPLVGIFGPVSERVYAPRPGPTTRVLTASVACRPCYQNFKFPKCENEKRCLTEINVARVVDAAKQLLGSAQTEGRIAAGQERP